MFIFLYILCNRMDPKQCRKKLKKNGLQLSDPEILAVLRCTKQKTFGERGIQGRSTNRKREGKLKELITIWKQPGRMKKDTASRLISTFGDKTDIFHRMGLHDIIYSAVLLPTQTNSSPACIPASES